jgi:hypothetical protein
VRSAIALAVVVALSGTVTAHAETEEGRQACMNDAFQFCGDAIPDHERVFRCLEARKQQISAACRANMPAEPAPARPAAKTLEPNKKAEHKTPARKTLSHAAERSAVKKSAPHPKGAAHKTLTPKRAASAGAPADAKPLSLVPAKGH